MGTRRVIAVLLVGVLLLGGGFLALVATGVIGHRPTLTPAQIAAARARRLLAQERRAASHALATLTVTPPTSYGAPAPAMPAQLFRTPLGSHQVVGFVPYWTLPELTAPDYAEATTLCYYGVSVTSSGTLLESGPEWGSAAATLASASFSSFVAAAHAAGDRVLLTLATADDAVIDKLVSHPTTTSAKLAPALAAIVAAHDLDGVNIDIEGTRPRDRAGYVRFATELTSALRQADPGGELMLDTYAGSAGSTKDFFDVKRLAPLVDALFVEGYDMNEPHLASSTAPLATNNLGYSEAQSLIEYTRLVSPRRLILGLPFYGYDYTTRSLTRRASLSAPAPEAVTYAAVQAVGRPALWDPVAAAPFTRFRRAGSPHQTYYDDPLSLAAKTALASNFHLLGVGAWAFGMEGGDAAMLAALSGGSPVVKVPLTTASSN